MPTNYDAVRTWAERMAASLTLNGEVERAVVAGSIRRGKEEPKDLEIVAQVKTVWRIKSEGLFGEKESLPEWDMSGLNDWLHSYIHVSKAFDYDQETKRNGTRYKRFRMNLSTGIGGMVFELWICCEEGWGNALGVRTGDKDFSHLLVTPRRKGGLMPDTLVQMQGRLWRYENWEDASAAREAKKPLNGVAIPCREESEFFGELGLTAPDPKDRTESTAKSLCYSPR